MVLVLFFKCLLKFVYCFFRSVYVYIYYWSLVLLLFNDIIGLKSALDLSEHY